MNPNNDGMGLHAFTGRHLFKIRQYLGAYIYLQAYIVHFVYILSKTYVIIYTGRRPTLFISLHHVQPMHSQSLQSKHLLYIHTYKRMAYSNKRL